jgi:hypothetical protein
MNPWASLGPSIISRRRKGNAFAPSTIPSSTQEARIGSGAKARAPCVLLSSSRVTDAHILLLRDHHPNRRQAHSLPGECKSVSRSYPLRVDDVKDDFVSLLLIRQPGCRFQLSHSSKCMSPEHAGDRNLIEVRGRCADSFQCSMKFRAKLSMGTLRETGSRATVFKLSLLRLRSVPMFRGRALGEESISFRTLEAIIRSNLEIDDIGHNQKSGR